MTGTFLLCRAWQFPSWSCWFTSLLLVAASVELGTKARVRRRLDSTAGCLVSAPDPNTWHLLLTERPQALGKAWRSWIQRWLCRAPVGVHMGADPVC